MAVSGLWGKRTGEVAVLIHKGLQLGGTATTLKPRLPSFFHSTHNHHGLLSESDIINTRRQQQPHRRPTKTILAGGPQGTAQGCFWASATHQGLRGGDGGAFWDEAGRDGEHAG